MTIKRTPSSFWKVLSRNCTHALYLRFTIPLSLERAARIAARMLPAGGEENTLPTTAAVRRPCPTKPVQGDRKTKLRG